MFEPRMQAMMRREIRASDDRHVPFEIANAIASEQTRILITDLYKRMLVKEGIPLKEIYKRLDNANNMAHANVFNNLQKPKFKTMVGEYWQRIEPQADATHEAGTGKPDD